MSGTVPGPLLGKQVALPAALSADVAAAVNGHIDDLQAHKARPHRGMAAIDMRHELDRLEVRNRVMVQTCLTLYQQLAHGSKNTLLESIRYQ